MKVRLVNCSDIVGGAARAAYRIHQALRQEGVDSTMHVNEANTDDWTVQAPTGRRSRAWARVRPYLGALATRAMKTSNLVRHSPAIMRSGWLERLNALEADVLHLNWINGEMLSVEEIGRLRKPVVWTLHDMWAFCGAEHYTEDLRWREGYHSHNRPDYETGLDLNRWTWRRKRRAWRRPMHIVTPSHWLAECVRQSTLMHDWPVTVVPNAIDTKIWQPVDKTVARQLLDLPVDVPLLLFGAMGGAADPRKGFDLLQKALQHLRGEDKNLQLIVFGQTAPREPEELGFLMHYFGHLHDDVSLRLLYSAVDALVIPSRQDNLPNTGVESLACGTPIVAFDTCGLPDIVRHEQTGYLAKAFDAEDLARGIQWVLGGGRQRYAMLSANAREDAVARFSYPVVARQYLGVYEAAIRSRHP